MTKPQHQQFCLKHFWNVGRAQHVGIHGRVIEFQLLVTCVGVANNKKKCVGHGSVRHINQQVRNNKDSRTQVLPFEDLNLEKCWGFNIERVKDGFYSLSKVCVTPAAGAICFVTNQWEDTSLTSHAELVGVGPGKQTQNSCFPVDFALKDRSPKIA